MAASDNSDQRRKATVTNNPSRLHITFIDKDGDEIKCEVAEGDNLLDIALEHDVEMEGK